MFIAAKDKTFLFFNLEIVSQFCGGNEINNAFKLKKTVTPHCTSDFIRLQNDDFDEYN